MMIPTSGKIVQRLCGIAACVLLVAAIAIFSGCKKQSYAWYVEPEFAEAWARIIREAPPPGPLREIHIWEGDALPSGPGILIATKPWHPQEKITVYNRLPFSREHRGALLLALDPWMVFQRYRNPPLTAGRAYPAAGGDGVLLVPGRDPESVRAWTARLIQGSPGTFPSDEQSWQEGRNNLFAGNRFPNGAETYNWQDVFFRLMGHEVAWLYAPLSAIRRYPNPRKSILEADAFPEREGSGSQYSLHATLLWALPVGPGSEMETMAPTLEWLKSPETQTIIADAIDWIPADPYGTPYDPVSLTSHRNWLTASFVYEINE